MTTTELLPEVQAETDYYTWMDEVRTILSAMNMEMEVWQQNWLYDFREEFEAGMAPADAAGHAHDFWWQQVFDESWT